MINEHSNINIDINNFDDLIEEKNRIIKKTKELFYYYDEIKMYLLYYTKNIKEIQNFNEGILKEIKDNFNSTKKKFNQIPKIVFAKSENNINSIKDENYLSSYNTIEDNLNIINSNIQNNLEENLIPKKEKKKGKKN